LADIYLKLGTRKPEEWSAAFLKSPQHAFHNREHMPQLEVALVPIAVIPQIILAGVVAGLPKSLSLFHFLHWNCS
jgi:hypothetical protein